LVNTITTSPTNVDTITNITLQWQTVTNKRTTVKVKRVVHTHMMILKTIIESIQTLVPKHVTYDTITVDTVIIQTLTSVSLSVGTLTTKTTGQRVVTSYQTSIKSLTSTQVSVKRVKKAQEEVSQEITECSKCLGSMGGKSVGVMKYETVHESGACGNESEGCGCDDNNSNKSGECSSN